MSRHSPVLRIAMLSLCVLATPGYAETLRCRSINGNINCAGSGAVSCQSVDGRTVCTGGHGAVEQSFGARSPTISKDIAPADIAPADIAPDDAIPDDDNADPAPSLSRHPPRSDRR